MKNLTVNAALLGIGFLSDYSMRPALKKEGIAVKGIGPFASAYAIFLRFTHKEGMTVEQWGECLSRHAGKTIALSELNEAREGATRKAYDPAFHDGGAGLHKQGSAVYLNRTSGTCVSCRASHPIGQTGKRKGWGARD